MASNFLKQKAQEELKRRNTSTIRQVVLPTARELSEEAKERLAKSEAFRSGALKYASADLTPSKKTVSLSDRPTASTLEDRTATERPVNTSAFRYLRDSGAAGVAGAIADWESAATMPRRVASDKLIDSIVNTPTQKSASREQKDAIAELQRDRNRRALFGDDGSAMDKLETELTEINKEDQRRKLTQLIAPEQKARESYNRINERLYEEGKNQSEAVRKAGDIVRSIGYMAPSMAIGGAYGGANAIGTAAMAAQSGGSGYEEARSEGAAAENALRYAIGKGLLTFGTEKAMGAIPGLGKGQLDDAVETLTGKLSNPWMQYLTRRGIDRAGESLEEVAEEFLTPYLKRATYDANAEAASGRDLLGAAASGFVVSSILGAPADVTGARAAMQGSRAQDAGSRIQSENTLQKEISLGLRNGRDTDSYKRAKDLQGKIDRGELLTEQEIGELHYANQNAIAEEQAMARRDRQDRIRYSLEQSKTEEAPKTILPTAAELAARTEQSAEPQYSIESIPGTEKQYVKADRQVVSGNDSSKWGKQIENYINNKVRNGQDVNVLTSDGDVLTLTERTAYKMSDRHSNRRNADGTKELLTDSEYRLKGTAAGHIDELTKISKLKDSKSDKDKKHQNDFAEDGFDYRKAYFMDADGTYYRMIISVGKNADGKVVYNIGKIQKRNAPSVAGSSSSLISEERGAPPAAVKRQANEGNVSSGYSISQTAEDVNTNMPSVTQSQNYLPTASEISARTSGTTARESGTEVGANEAAIRMAERLSFAFDRDVVFYNQPATKAGTENGYYQDGKIYVNVNSRNPLVEIFSHELTHSTESSELYNGLESFVREQMPDFDNQIKAKREEYRKQGVTLDQNGAAHELVAEFAAKNLFANEQEIYEMALQQPKLAQRMQMWIDTALSKLGSASAADRVMLNRAKSLYANALDNIAESSRQYSLTPNDTDGSEDETPTAAPGQVVLPTAEELTARDNVNAEVDNVKENVDDELIEEVINEPMDDMDQDWTLLESDAMEGYETREEMEAARRRDLDDYNKMMQDLAETQVHAEPITDPKEKVKVKTEKKKKSLEQHARESWSYYKRKLVDSGETVARIGKATKDKHLYQYYNMARASSNAAISMITEKQADVTGKTVGKGLNEIFEPIRSKDESGEYYRDFQLYLFHMHNIDRMSRHDQKAIDEAKRRYVEFKSKEPVLARFSDDQIKRMAYDQNSDYYPEASKYMELLDAMHRAENMKNKPVFAWDVSAETSRIKASELQIKYPEFKDKAKEVYEYINNLLQYRVDSGLITREDVAKLKKVYPHYVPVYRDFESKGVSQIDKKNVIISKTIGKAEGSNEVIMPLHRALAQQTLKVVREGSLNRFGTRLMQDGAKNKNKVSEDILNIQDSMDDFHENTFDDLEKDLYERVNSFVVRNNGRKYEIAVSPALYEAVKALSPDPKEAKAITKAVRGANDLYKKLITAYNPTFVVRNFLKDLPDALLNSKNSIPDFVKSYVKAIYQIYKNGEYWQQYKALGGTYSSLFDYDTGDVKKNKSKILERVESLNVAIEQAPRLAEFIATVENNGGDMDNLMEAMYNAADITTNFGRSGTLGKELNANWIPFLNPSIQGFSKGVRNITETKGIKEWLNLALKAAVFGVVPRVINELIFGDDDEWDELRDSDKDSSYLLKIGDGQWIKIPQGRLVSVIGMAADRTMDAIQGEDIDWKDTANTVLNQVGPTNPLKENIAAPWFDTALFNPDDPGKTWYGSEIENQRLQGYAPGERHDNKTDAFSKWLGSVTNLSPKKINYLMNQYLGVVADVVLPFITPASNKNIGSLLLSSFTLDSTASNELSTQFYETMDDLTYAKNAAEATGVDEVVYKYWNKQKTAVNDINAAIREIEVDKSLSNKDRQELIRAQYAIRNQLERNALDLLEDYKATAEKYYNGSKLQDEDDKVAYAYREANREVYGAEYALQVYNKDVYAKATELYKQGVSYDEYYDMYFDMKEVKTKNKGYQKSNAIRNIIAGAPISENAKKTVYRDEFSDSRDDDIEAFKDAGLSFNKYLVVQNKYAEINENVDGASNKALELARWVEQQGFDEDAAATIKQSFTYYSQIPAQTDKYDEMLGLDIDDEAAAEVLSAIAALEPLEGKTSVSDKQKYQAIMDTNLTYNEKLRAYEVYMGESAYQKLSEAVDNGIDMEDYITYVIDTADIKADKDASGKTISGSKKSKILDYINSMPISSSQKDTLYLMAGYSDKTLDETPWYGKASNGSIFSSRGGSATFGSRSSGSGFANRSTGNGFADRSSGTGFASRSTSTGFGNRSSNTTFNR